MADRISSGPRPWLDPDDAILRSQRYPIPGQLLLFNPLSGNEQLIPQLPTPDDE